MLKRILPLAAVATLVVLPACSPPTSTNPTTPGGAASTPGPTPTAAGGPAPLCEYLPTGEPAKPVDPPATEDIETSGEVTITLQMTEGPVSITMDRANAPCAVHSFESLAAQDYYDGTSCHRLSDSGQLLMLQCGDPTGDGTGGPGYRYAEEVTGQETYDAGTVAMAKTQEPSSTGGQFFLVYDDSALPPEYTVVGQMDEASRAVVARMSAEGQDGSYPDGTGRPNNPSEITDVTVG
ncbi:peptidylprolyl isomerase [Auraticoccus monumenti]|uniref:Peptidyl-prolyl cis-trans isomerase B (Cyclophilin B) n=1 Tax=Auraticoccus monumenti TaxID=675864 RepID=A0A1G7AYU7_9ACTN|nr:peptidylprolyl isomerase [Auraticoccus monumenti]SDE19882.1 peptidyl-prolyl cis-trans isomerase B (cyclophilin B) [Auraticoccus monumenti]